MTSFWGVRILSPIVHMRKQVWGGWWRSQAHEVEKGLLAWKFNSSFFVPPVPLGCWFSLWLLGCCGPSLSKISYHVVILFWFFRTLYWRLHKLSCSFAVVDTKYRQIPASAVGGGRGGGQMRPFSLITIFLRGLSALRPRSFLAVSIWLSHLSSGLMVCVPVVVIPLVC